MVLCYRVQGPKASVSDGWAATVSGLRKADEGQLKFVLDKYVSLYYCITYLIQ